MQILKFVVTGQKIAKDTESPFSKMVAGTSGYYIAEFVFDDAWDGYASVACFKHGASEIYRPIKNRRCEMPDEILGYSAFSVSVIGKKNNNKILTNEIRVLQKGGKQ